MPKSQTQHAKQVVAAFKEKISNAANEHIGQKHFDELELLIESAMSSAVYIEMERVAEKITSFANDIRNSTGRFD